MEETQREWAESKDYSGDTGWDCLSLTVEWEAGLEETAAQNLILTHTVIDYLFLEKYGYNSVKTSNFSALQFAKTVSYVLFYLKSRTMSYIRTWYMEGLKISLFLVDWNISFETKNTISYVYGNTPWNLGKERDIDRFILMGGGGIEES